MVGQAFSNLGKFFHPASNKLGKFFCHPATLGILGALGVAVVAAAIVVPLKVGWRNSAPTRATTSKMSDPSVVIGTFITLYTVFIGGFGSSPVFL